MVNHNVRITFLVRITDGIATGIWASSVLSTYINVLEGDNDKANERVGYAQAIQGTFLAAAAIPAGWLAITHRRDSILKVMGLVAFAAIATTSTALVLDVPYKYSLLCCGLALWGVAQANAPVLDALFADSVPTGNRSKLYTWLHMCYIVAQGIGPGVGAAMFALNGNVWKLEVLQRVMLVGMALAAVPALLMLCFDDDKTLGAESEGLLRTALLSPATTAAGDEEEGAKDEAEGEEEAFSGGGGRRRCDPESYGSYGSQSPSHSPGGAEADYRRPFLDGWCSDTERDYRNPVSPALSPARPVFPAIAAAGGGGGGGDRGPYVPPDLALPTSGDAGSPSSNSETAAAANSVGHDAAAAAAVTAGPAMDGGAAGAVVCSPQVGSHALLLSPTTTDWSLATDRSGVNTPSFRSPTPSPGPGGSGRDAAPGTRAERAATSVAAVAEPAERFHAVRQAVDGAAEAKAYAADAVKAADLCDLYDRRRSVSLGGGPVGAAAAAAGGESGCSSESGAAGENGAAVVADAADAVAAVAAPAAGGDTSGYESAAGSSREPSLMADSLPSELSFNSLLGPASFKSAHSRPFSRTGSSSSCGSARDRDRSSGGGAAVVCSLGAASAAAAPPPLALLPHPEEEDLQSEGGPELGGEPETPTLEPSVQRTAGGRQPPPPVLRHPPLPPAAAAGRSGGGGGGGPAGSRGAGSPGYDRSLYDTSKPAAATAGAGRVANGSGGGGSAGATPVGGRWPPAASAGAAREPLPLPPPPPPQMRARNSLDPRRHRFLCLTMAWIPGVLALTDCIMGLASGMTIKFFPIFFKDEVRLPPMYVNLMYCAIPLCLSAAAYVAQRESRLLGRVQAMVLNRGIGICILYWIATHDNRWHDQRLMVPVYIARTSIMNSIYPLQKSILMDFVPKERRAAWNSLESVTSFGWSGSAALGGWLIHKFGFRTTFLITATMQCMGWCMSMLLLPIVPRREVGLRGAVAGGGGAGGRGSRARG